MADSEQDPLGQKFEAAKAQVASTKWAGTLAVEEFLRLADIAVDAHEGASLAAKVVPRIPILDVRSPGEFEVAHIPGAHSVPLFSNQERAVVGKSYKSNGKEIAIRTGLRFVNKSWRNIVSLIESIVGPAPAEVLVYCWRGGMRSGSVATLLATLGYNVHTLSGGYKSFRKWGREVYENKPLQLVIIRGRTGCGKTDLLIELRDKHNAQIIDLEGEANHRGSHFGNLGKQPTVEMFENRLAMAWNACTAEKPVFIEDESRSVGKIAIPLAFWDRKEATKLSIRLEMEFQARIAFLVGQYGDQNGGTLSTEQLIQAGERLKKRLGGQDCKAYIEAVEKGDLSTAAEIVTTFYDKKYDKWIARFDDEIKRTPVLASVVRIPGGSPKAVAPEVLAIANEWMAALDSDADTCAKFGAAGVHRPHHEPSASVCCAGDGSVGQQSGFSRVQLAGLLGAGLLAAFIYLRVKR